MRLPEAMEYAPAFRRTSPTVLSRVRFGSPVPGRLTGVAAPEERRRREARIETWHREGWRRAPGGQVRGHADDTDSVRWVDGLERAQELARLPE